MSNRNDNLSERLRQGRQLLRDKHKAGDAAKLGNLRAGNSGIMSEDGDVAGSCHRVAHLRQLGLELDPPDDSRLVMFQMGTANEDVVYHDLVQTSAPDEVILREEEIPIEWMTSNGTKVTGRPDMVVCQIHDTQVKGSFPRDVEGAGVYCLPKWGVELKSIASVWTSRDVLHGEPKMANLIQAAHYSWKLGVPFRLMYKQYGIQEIPNWKGRGSEPGWGQKLFPVGCADIDYEKGRIRPYERTFELLWGKDGYLRYRLEGSTGVAVKTLIRLADIERFYEYTSRISEDKVLGKRPLTIDSKGKEKSYSNCSYCPLQKTCDKVDKGKAENRIGYDTWLHLVKEQLELAPDEAKRTK